MDLFEDKQKERQNIHIYIEGESKQKMISLKSQQLKNIRTLKKKILNQFGYEQSQGKKIQLNIMQAYPSQPEHIKTPVFNQVNLKLIVDFLISYERSIKVQATFICEEDKGNLNRKQVISQEALDQGEIHFDQNGSLIQEKDQMKQIIPLNEKYDNSIGHVRCAFCLKNNQNKIYLKKCGGFYGPFQGKYVHILCAIWCHRVFIDEKTGLLRNVQQQIKRAQKIKCKQCKETGAGLTCDGRSGRKNKCNSHYHFKCLFDANSAMNWITFKFLCPKCKDNQNLYQSLFNQAQQKSVQKPSNHSRSKPKQVSNQNSAQISSVRIVKQQSVADNSQIQSIKVKREHFQ